MTVHVRPHNSQTDPVKFKYGLPGGPARIGPTGQPSKWRQRHLTPPASQQTPRRRLRLQNQTDPTRVLTVPPCLTSSYHQSLTLTPRSFFTKSPLIQSITIHACATPLNKEQAGCCLRPPPFLLLDPIACSASYTPGAPATGDASGKPIYSSRLLPADIYAGEISPARNQPPRRYR